MFNVKRDPVYRVCHHSLMDDCPGDNCCSSPGSDILPRLPKRPTGELLSLSCTFNITGGGSNNSAESENESSSLVLPGRMESSPAQPRHLLPSRRHPRGAIRHSNLSESSGLPEYPTVAQGSPPRHQSEGSLAMHSPTAPVEETPGTPPSSLYAPSSSAHTSLSQRRPRLELPDARQQDNYNEEPSELDLLIGQTTSILLAGNESLKAVIEAREHLRRFHTLDTVLDR